MSKLEKAAAFYLRGFNSQYIKRRTGISMQSLLKQQLAKGIRYTKEDIIHHQIAYIRDRYTDDDIKKAYRDMSREYADPYKATRGRHIVMLGCAFGNYKRVFSDILGADTYKQLRNECWKKKQVATVKANYGVSNVFEKETYDQFVTAKAAADGRRERTEALVERYGVEHPNEHPNIAAKMIESLETTMLDHYGVDNPMKAPGIAMKSAYARQSAMKEKYGAGNSVQVKAIRDKIFNNRRKNRTLHTSKPEQELGVLLRAYFGDDDVLYNVVVDDRYPFRVDYYIKSLDLFIELNGDRCHNTHWYDASNSRDQQIVRSWIENMNRLELESGKPSRYRQFIQTWTERDVKKRLTAKVNKLNYLVFWDGSCKQVNKKQVPNLSDVYAWFDAGCPSPQNWLPENTY
ncbi:hypothetical protein JUJ52_03275 [Virgibacillus sp. AGTR]|uniref:DUF7487 domain-containing protein n=1 Tax=Virgibacillus sp. AGTR TaxID=2812055 RepID=UPI001D1633F5|nr:hypothetical protein [Virgibacillus sp. AGTR]MCC2248979.1 hypothetical protein [Virgibacillus sp. AGTR]